MPFLLFDIEKTHVRSVFHVSRVNVMPEEVTGSEKVTSMGIISPILYIQSDIDELMFRMSGVVNAYAPPPTTVPTIIEPSTEDVRKDHLRTIESSSSIHVLPLLTDTYTLPLSTAATSLLPSAEDATEVQLRLSTAVRPDQVLPPLPEV